jgi:hypothetical protein
MSKQTPLALKSWYSAGKISSFKYNYSEDLSMNEIKNKRKSRISRFKGAFLMFIVSLTVLMPGASADYVENGSINWTAIGDMIKGVAEVFPGILEVVSNIVPLLIVLAVLGFVVGLFDKILGAIENAVRIFR